MTLTILALDIAEGFGDSQTSLCVSVLPIEVEVEMFQEERVELLKSCGAIPSRLKPSASRVTRPAPDNSLSSRDRALLGVFFSRSSKCLET